MSVVVIAGVLFAAYLSQRAKPSIEIVESEVKYTYKPTPTFGDDERQKFYDQKSVPVFGGIEKVDDF